MTEGMKERILDAVSKSLRGFSPRPAVDRSRSSSYSRHGHKSPPSMPTCAQLRVAAMIRSGIRASHAGPVTLRTLGYKTLPSVQNSPRPIKSSSESAISAPQFRQALSRAGPL